VRARVESLSPRALIALAAAAVLLFAVAAWFLVVSPKRADASAATADLAAAQSRFADAQAALARPSVSGTTVTDVLLLTKAMPSSDDQAGLILELTRLARVSGVTLKGITPQEPVAGLAGPTSIPVSVVVNGRYHDVERFLMQTRRLVTVRKGEVDARGRLLSVRGVTLGESDTGEFPQLDAVVDLDAYVYDGPITPAETPEPEAEEEEPDSSSSAAAGSGS
jgi:Tfp pilus assembly protein PilO